MSPHLPSQAVAPVRARAAFQSIDRGGADPVACGAGRLADDAATARFGAALAAALRPGDAVMLQGGLGAGKTALARAAILSLLAAPEDVPSPTFTLVQTYEGASGEIWHADLYRLGDPDEAAELGLEEAFETAVVFVEWPERLGPLTPARRFEITLAVPAEGEGRAVSWRGIGGGWEAVEAAALAGQEAPA